uniref:Uncharacterized protein n=1 Tax=Knipowitschia caucasica TaxID=637954 RepID=A0AAV2LC07_KNICA
MPRAGTGVSHWGKSRAEESNEPRKATSRESHGDEARAKGSHGGKPRAGPVKPQGDVLRSDLHAAAGLIPPPAHEAQGEARELRRKVLETSVPGPPRDTTICTGFAQGLSGFLKFKSGFTGVLKMVTLETHQSQELQVPALDQVSGLDQVLNSGLGLVSGLTQVWTRSRTRTRDPTPSRS